MGWVVGAMLSIFGSIASNLGVNIQVRTRDDAADSSSTTRSDAPRRRCRPLTQRAAPARPTRAQADAETTTRRRESNAMPRTPRIALTSSAVCPSLRAVSCASCLPLPSSSEILIHQASAAAAQPENIALEGYVSGTQIAARGRQQTIGTQSRPLIRSLRCPIVLCVALSLGRRWLSGLGLVIFGSLGDFAALSMVAQSIVAPSVTHRRAQSCARNSARVDAHSFAVRSPRLLCSRATPQSRLHHSSDECDLRSFLVARACGSSRADWHSAHHLWFHSRRGVRGSQYTQLLE